MSGGVRASILLHSAASGAAIGLVLSLLVVGVLTIATQLLPLPAHLARVLERRGWALALAGVVACVAAGAVLGWLEGRLKLR